MSRGPRRFTQNDVTKTLKGALKAGIDIYCIQLEIDHSSGNIKLIVGKPNDQAPADKNEWDAIR
jgi:hypothetical protein